MSNVFLFNIFNHKLHSKNGSEKIVFVFGLNRMTTKTNAFGIDPFSLTDELNNNIYETDFSTPPSGGIVRKL